MAKIAASERDEFYEQRRAELAAAALRLWARDGFDSTSVAAIAKETGISKGTFYLFFPSKQALLEEVMRRYSLLPNVEKLAAGMLHLPFEDAVREFVRLAWQHLDTNRDVIMLALRELPRDLDVARKAVANVLVPGNRLIAQYLESQVGAERAQEISLIVAGRGLMGMIVMMFVSHTILEAGEHLPLDEETITASIAEVFLHGVRSGKGTPA